MSNKQPKGKDWSQDREGAFKFVFLTHRWGDSMSSGKTPKTGGYANKLKNKSKSKNKE